MKAVASAAPDSWRDEYSKRMRSSEELTELANIQVRDDYPLLNALSTVYLWSLLDSFIYDYLALWISRRPSARSVAPLKRVRIDFADYESLRPKERHYYIIKRLGEDVGANRHHGMYRFRKLLEPFELSFKLKNDIERDLIELQNVRNIIVHRSSTIDRRFKQACPWIKQNTGTQIKLSSSQAHNYYHAASAVILNLIYQVRTVYGDDFEKEKSEWQNIRH